MITACQLQKLTKQGQPVFLAIIRPTDGVPHARKKKGGAKKSPAYAAAAHGMTERQKRKISKETGLKKDWITVAPKPYLHQRRTADFGSALITSG